MRGIKCSLLALALSACATAPTPGIKVEYVDRPVITETKCVKEKDIPVKPAPLAGFPVPDNVERALSIAMAKVSEWTRYGNRTDPILRSCAAKD